MTKNIKGLTLEEVHRSKEKYGDNSLVKEKTKSFFRKFIENLNDPIIKVLIFALIIEVVFTFGKCNFFEIGGIVAAILIATTVSTASEYGSEKAFLKMQKDSLESFVRVLRGGEIIEIASCDIVVGDIVYLFTGEKIQADGIIISGSLKVDQAALNGESREVTKCVFDGGTEWDLSDMGKVFRGSLITGGEAIMKVMRVGAQTYYGMVAKDVQNETRESPLKIRLAKFAAQISKIGYVMAGIVAFTYLFNTFIVDNGFIGRRILESLSDGKFVFSTLVHALTLMITVVVVAAPEGLPMMITVVLSANMKKMLKDGVIVKKLVGIETAGSMNILFTDKTGTLTTGKLECDKIICADASYKSISSLKKCNELFKYVILNAKYNTSSMISGEKIIGGNSTDKAIAECFRNESVSDVKIRSKNEFTSDKKYSSVVLENGLTLIKGAPEIIISKSVYSLDSYGNLISIPKLKIQEEYIREASSGNRVIAMAYKSPMSEDLVF